MNAVKFNSHAQRNNIIIFTEVVFVTKVFGSLIFVDLLILEFIYVNKLSKKGNYVLRVL